MLTSRQELQALRAQATERLQAENKRIIVCAGAGCVSKGALKIYDKFADIMKEKGIKFSLELQKEPHSDSVRLKQSGCHGFCEIGPLVRIEPQGWLYVKVGVEDCEEIIEKTIVNGECVDRLAYTEDGKVYREQKEIPFYKKQTRMILDNCDKIDASSIEEYLATGGYTALEKALFDMSSEDIINEISESGLRGRGGGGFPAGRKWSQVARQNNFPKYVVCNGDEGDPGAFMDRSVMEDDPHRMIEGMVIAGIATGANDGISTFVPNIQRLLQGLRLLSNKQRNSVYWAIIFWERVSLSKCTLTAVQVRSFVVKGLLLPHLSRVNAVCLELNPRARLNTACLISQPFLITLKLMQTFQPL